MQEMPLMSLKGWAFCQFFSPLFYCKTHKIRYVGDTVLLSKQRE